MFKSSETQLLMESIQYGTQKIQFHLQRVNRKTLGIEVHPDMSVWAIAPLNATLSEIKKKILKRSAWIIRQRNYFEQFLPRTPERQYVSGETHLYLGRRYVLKIQIGNEDGVKLKGFQLIVTTLGEQSSDQIKKLLASWYYHHAQNNFEKKIKAARSLFKSYGIANYEFEIRRMKNRWGSCTPKGKVILNPELIKAPGPCIDYVIIHELCHLIHPNHSKDFYNLQNKLNPNWNRWKLKLESTLI